MKASELIDVLRQQIATHGDQPCVVALIFEEEGQPELFSVEKVLSVYDEDDGQIESFLICDQSLSEAVSDRDIPQQ